MHSSSRLTGPVSPVSIRLKIPGCRRPKRVCANVRQRRPPPPNISKLLHRSKHHNHRPSRRNRPTALSPAWTNGTLLYPPKPSHLRLPFRASAGPLFQEIQHGGLSVYPVGGHVLHVNTLLLMDGRNKQNRVRRALDIGVAPNVILVRLCMHHDGCGTPCL